MVIWLGEGPLTHSRSYGVIYIPWFGIEAAYAGAEEELASALGIYLIGWFIGEYLGREEREYAR